MVAGCGGGGGGGGQDVVIAPISSNKPVISNLSYSPKSAVVNQGGGFLTVSGTVSFMDQDGDISLVTITTRDAVTGTQLSTLTEPVTGLSGAVSGVVFISVVTGTTTAGNYLFDVTLKDKAGNVSNTLTGTFKVGS